MANRKKPLSLPPLHKKKNHPILEDSELNDQPNAVLDFNDLHRLSEEVSLISDENDFGETSLSQARQAGYVQDEKPLSPKSSRRSTARR